MELLHHWLTMIVNAAILLFEYIGTLIIVYTGVRSLTNFIRRKNYVRLELAEGLAMGLEFKLGSEILRTVIINDISELYIVAGVILLRAALTFLIHWEIQGEAPKRHTPVMKRLQREAPSETSGN